MYTQRPAGALGGKMADQLPTGIASDFTLNLVKSIIGTAVLSLPYVMGECGPLLTIVLIVLCAGLTHYSLALLGAANEIALSRGITPSFESFAYMWAGRVGRALVDTTLCATAVGGVVAGIRITRDIALETLGLDPADPLFGFPAETVVVCVTVAAIAALSAMEGMGSFAIVSKLATVLYIVFAGAIFMCVVDGSHSEAVPLYLWRPSALFAGFPIVCFAFTCQMAFFSIFESARAEDRSEIIAGVAKAAVWKLVVPFYVAVGFCGFVAFGPQPPANILNAMGGTVAHRLVRAAFGFTIVFSSPPSIYAARDVIVSYMVPSAAAGDAEAGRATAARTAHAMLTRKRIVAVALTLLGWWVAVSVTQLQTIFGLIGSTTGVLVGMVFPAVFFLACVRQDANAAAVAQRFGVGIAGARALLVFGIVMGVGTTAAVLLK